MLHDYLPRDYRKDLMPNEKKKDTENVIWMTRKMPIKVLNRMRVLSAHMSTSRKVPLWKIHQLVLAAGVQVLEKQRGIRR